MVKPNFSWSDVKCNLDWVKSSTVFMARAGSWAYGTNTETSDEDWRGIAIPPKQYVLGTLNRFEQVVIKEPDITIFDLRKFVHLASNCNPNFIELLFTDPTDIVFCDKTVWKNLETVRNWFLTKRVRHTYSGYAISQLKRIQLHQRYIQNPPRKKPERSDFGLPENTLVPSEQLKAVEAEIQKKIDTWSISYLDGLDDSNRLAVVHKFAEHLAEIGIATTEELWLPAAKTLGATDNLIEAMKKERAYTSAKREYDNYLSWQKNRNPVRAAMEAESGFDRKHASHLVRLLRQAKEILTGKGVIVKRPDAEELLSIRNGSWTYDELIEYADKMDKELDELVKKSNLPSSPPVHLIDSWLCDTLENFYGYK